MSKESHAFTKGLGYKDSVKRVIVQWRHIQKNKCGNDLDFILSVSTAISSNVPKKDNDSEKGIISAYAKNIRIGLFSNAKVCAKTCVLRNFTVSKKDSDFVTNCDKNTKPIHMERAIMKDFV